MKKLLLIILTLFSFSLFSQHSIHADSVIDTPIKQGVAILYGSSLLPEYDHNGNEIGKALMPSVSLDYEIWWKHKVGILLMNEFILNSYEVKSNEGEYLERESILISVMSLGYSPVKNFGIYAGLGIETDLSSGHQFGLFKVGAAYSIPINRNWASILALAGDFRKQYESVSFEIGFARFF